MFAYGPDELIKQVNEIITKNNSDDSEITVLKKGEMNSVLSVSRTKSIFEVDESIYFFKGWFQDYEAQSIVLGEKGFQDWLERQEEVDESIDFEGAYVSAKIKN